MEVSRRRSFTEDYKRQAVDLVASSGRSIGEFLAFVGPRQHVINSCHGVQSSSPTRRLKNTQEGFAPKGSLFI